MPWDPSIGRPWHVNCAASGVELILTESGNPLIRVGWVDGRAAPAEVAPPTLYARQATKAAPRAASFMLSDLLTDRTPRLRWRRPRDAASVPRRVRGGAECGLPPRLA